MGIRDTLDRLRATRLSRDRSDYDTAEHEAMAERYEKKKKFHTAHNKDKPKSESAKQKVLKSVMSHGKKFVEASKKKAIEEAKRQSKKKSKKSKTKKTKPELKEPPTPSFNFGFGLKNEQFGFGMFNPSTEQKDVDWSKVYNFRMNTNSPFKKKKSDFENVFDYRGFWK